MAIYHKGKELSKTLHEGKIVKHIYHMGKKYINWLSSDTKAAIRLAFGEEAGQVIESTNAYLDTIASTDAQRAQQLSGFINEDPLLVCSLVETSKVRGLKGDRLAFINTGYYVNNPSQVELYIDFKTVDDRSVRISPYIPLCGARSSTSTQTLDSVTLWSYELNNKLYIRCDIVDDLSTGDGLYDDLTYQNFYASVPNKIATMKGVTYKGNLKVKATTKLTEPFKIFTTTEIGKRYYGGTIYRCRLLEEGEDKVYCIPFLRSTGEAGMLDIVSFQFYPNANTEGVFTIELTDK